MGQSGEARLCRLCRCCVAVHSTRRPRLCSCTQHPPSPAVLLYTSLSLLCCYTILCRPCRLSVPAVSVVARFIRNDGLSPACWGVKKWW